MARLPVVTYPDAVLLQKALPVTVFDESVVKLGRDMTETMYAADGVGLAAPQVGLTIRLFVCSPTFDPGDRRVYVNPRLIEVDGKQESEEGCLSLPGVSCKVKRYLSATVEACDLEGNVFQESAMELQARIYQHEIDHLDGTLLINRMGTVARMANRKAIRELEEEFQLK